MVRVQLTDTGTKRWHDALQLGILANQPYSMVSAPDQSENWMPRDAVESFRELFGLWVCIM